MKTPFAYFIIFLCLLTACRTVTQHQPQLPLALTLDGLSPFSANTPFNVREIRTLLPQYHVQILQTQTRRDQTQSIEIRNHDRLLVTLYAAMEKNTIFSATIHSNQLIKDPHLYLGQRFEQLLNAQTANCLPGLGIFLNKVICEIPGTSRLLYIFTGNHAIAHDQLPPANQLNHWRVEKIIWLLAPPTTINTKNRTTAKAS